MNLVVSRFFFSLKINMREWKNNSCIFICFNLVLLMIDMNKYKKFNLIIIFATLACHIN